MKARTRRWVGVAALLAVAMAWAAPEAEAARGGRNSRYVRREKKPRYIVVQVRDYEGEIAFEVIESDKLRERQKKAYQDFVEAAKEWVALRKEAKKLKEEFDDPRPKKPIVKKLSKTFKEKAEADTCCEKWEERYEKYLEKKRAASEKGDDFRDIVDDEKKKGDRKKRGKDRDDGEKADKKREKGNE